METKTSNLISSYLEIIIEYLNNEIDGDLFSYFFIETHDSDSLEWSTFVTENKKIDMYIEDVFCYSLLWDELEEMGVTVDEYSELVYDLLLLMVDQLKEAKRYL